MLFLDSSVLARAYLPDEPGHGELRALVFESGGEFVASELIVVEVTRAFAAAGRARRLPPDAVDELLARFDTDVRAQGMVALIPLDRGATLERARELVLTYPLGSFDAVHLAVAETDGRRLAADDDLIFVTRDEDQRLAAEALGFATA